MLQDIDGGEVQVDDDFKAGKMASNNWEDWDWLGYFEIAIGKTIGLISCNWDHHAWKWLGWQLEKGLVDMCVCFTPADSFAIEYATIMNIWEPDLVSRFSGVTRFYFK